MINPLRYIRENKTLGLRYCVDFNDAPGTDLLKQAGIKTKNHLMAFSDSSWQEFLDSGRSTVAYIVFYHGWKIDHGRHVPVPVAQSSTESKYNAAYTAGMALAHSRILIHEFLKKDSDSVPEEDPLIALDRKSTMCVSKNDEDTNHTKHIARIMHLVRNGGKCKMKNIDWCEGGLQLADIVTKNVSEPDLTPIMKCMMVRLEN